MSEQKILYGHVEQLTTGGPSTSPPLETERMKRILVAFVRAFEAMRHSNVENTDKDWFFDHPTLIEAMDDLGNIIRMEQSRRKP
jgi:hypothetical protein